MSHSITPYITPGIAPLLAEVDAERVRQDLLFGEQNHPDGTGGAFLVKMAHVLRAACQEAADQGQLTWRRILMEECGEAFAETDPYLLRAELVQIIAVGIAWIQAIDRRTAVGADYIEPQDRAAEWARMAGELAASGYSETRVAQALAVDEQTVQRLLEARGEGA
ncbi:hypothetical protein KN815_16085 [Streptomyces sp. 4503]|uniref:Uncharacterized protein n=1 Tax=Streptomyces niphimycinicus TaxID=2842201 RepID=A0ABS6CF52_9ACTN|nr:hypothetical protein [Streptomyces niphimycinicus]MBU3865541.1 hypothetical protein [Streptomyces niphimycinicus]